MIDNKLCLNIYKISNKQYFDSILSQLSTSTDELCIDLYLTYKLKLNHWKTVVINPTVKHTKDYSQTCLNHCVMKIKKKIMCKIVFVLINAL